MKEYAKVTWDIVDIESLRPEWSVWKCKDFLEENARYIQDAMIVAGWDAIESLLPSREKTEM
jgi:hypothetical protein